MEARVSIGLVSRGEGEEGSPFVCGLVRGEAVYPIHLHTCAE